jgi:hypothetical protein
MKHRIIILSFFLLITLNSFSQNENSPDYVHENSPIKTNLNLGVKYIPFDYTGGIIMGLSLQKNKIGVHFKNEIDISFYQRDTPTLYGYNKKYRTYKYLDISYDILTHSTILIGFGWIDREVTSFGIPIIRDYGYAVASIGGEYMLSETIRLGFRGNFPLEKRDKLFDQGFAFPVSFSVLYILK